MSRRFAQQLIDSIRNDAIKAGIDPKVALTAVGLSGAGALTGLGAQAVDLVTGPSQFYNSGELLVNPVYNLLPYGGAIGGGYLGGQVAELRQPTPAQVDAKFAAAKKNAVNRAREIGSEAAIKELADIKNSPNQLKSNLRGRRNTFRLAGSVLGQLAGLGMMLPKLQDDPAVQETTSYYYG